MRRSTSQNGPGAGAYGPARACVRANAVLAVLSMLVVTGGCAKKTTAPVPLAPRTYAMGFSPNPPSADFALAVRAIQTWTTRADIAQMGGEPPWDSLLAGLRPDSLVIRNQLVLAQYFRAQNLKLFLVVDPLNGLNRASDSDPLKALGHSLTEPAMRALARAYAVALDTLLRPDYLELAVETNLVRAYSPAPLYQAEILFADSAAADVRAVDATVRLVTSVQVDQAWGHIGPPAVYQGIDQDRIDFAFEQVLGMSSYPYLSGFAKPEDIPADYYSKLVQGAPIPVIITEGGWSSASVAGIPSDPDKQRRYIVKQAALCDRVGAIGWMQIPFTDIDLASLPPPYNTSVAPFAYLGLVDATLRPKPALSAWDAVFARPRQ
jgi:hypothetical protein